MSTSNKLKAYVRFDGSGRVVPSSLILARFKPKVGNYQEIDAYECCNDVPTTTTTTTQPTVYSFIGGNGFGSKGEACFAGQTSTYYTNVPESSITNGTVIYTNSGLTTPQSLYPYLAIAGIAYECSGSGVLSNGSAC